MITKDSVFAQGGVQDPNKTLADFREGMIPNTVAMAEDVNTYGNWSDRDLKVVCDEIVNALQAYGINPNGSYTAGSSTQLSEMLVNKVKGAFALTGIDYTSYTIPPQQSADGATITFPAFTVIFNTAVYYGDTKAQQIAVNVPQQTLTANSSWAGSCFIYVDRQGAITAQSAPVDGSEGASKCFLGSAFVVNGNFQPGSWKFQPWLQGTSLERRESPTATKKGGFISPGAGNAIQMGMVEVLDEGINFDEDPLKPSIKRIQGVNPFTYKLLYPNYSAADAAYEDLTFASTHLYDMTDNQLVDISAYTGKFICLVPCIVPTGQTLMIPAMGNQGGANGYDTIFDTVEQAQAAIFGLQYETNNTTRRAIYLGQTLIVKIGITDTSDSTSFVTVGQIPQALAGFTDASGQTGGGAGQYIPMKVTDWPVQQGVTLNLNQQNIVHGSPDYAVTITMPSPATGTTSQTELIFQKTADVQGLNFQSGIVWWGSAPSWVNGNTYEIIIDYIDGRWRAGYLTMTA